MTGPLLILALAVGRAGAEGPETREQARLCLERRGAESVEACGKAIALGLSPRRSALVHEVFALRLAALKRWDDVVRVYAETVRLKPEDPEARLRLGSALLQGQGRPEDAIPSFREAIRLKPYDPRPFASLGAALNALGRHAEAAEALAEAQRLDPGYFDNHPAARLILEASRRGERWP